MGTHVEYLVQHLDLQATTAATRANNKQKTRKNVKNIIEK